MAHRDDEGTTAGEARFGTLPVLLMVAGALATAALLWLTGVPLGVSGEWTWDRHDLADADGVDLLLGAAVAAVCAGGWIAFVRAGASRIDTASRFATFGWLAGSTVGGFGLLWGLQTAIPGDYTAIKSSWVLYDRGASGYFFEAAHEADDVAAYLAHYEALTAGDYIPYGETEEKRDVYHIGTHPPGLILLHRGLLSLCRRSESLAEFALATQPARYAETFDVLERNARYTPQRLPQPDRAALWLAVLLTHAVAAGAIVPLFLLVRLTRGSRAAFLTAAFWPLVPALAVFLPKSDALLPFVGLLFLWLWLSALRRESVVRAVLSGLVMFGGMLVSLALLPVALLAVLLTVWETVFAEEADRSWRSLKRPLLLAGVSLAAFASAILLLWLLGDANLLQIWVENFRNHAGFYERESNPRSYGKWLIANAVELTLAVGWPAVLPALFHLAHVAANREERRRRINGDVWCAAAVIGLLWISGKNMGEAGRLWLFLTPWILWMGAGLWQRTLSRRMWLAFLAVQFAVCLMTVLRVRGFHFLGG